MSTVQDEPIVNKTKTNQYQTVTKSDAEIHNFDDLVFILKTHPMWLEEIRRLVLTDELMLLPKKIDDFVKNEFHPLKEDVSGLKQDVVILKEDVKVLKKDVEVLKEDVAVLKQDVSILKEEFAVLKQDVEILKIDVVELKGDNFERKVREKAPSYFGAFIKKCRVLSSERLADMLDDAVDNGILTEAERDDALRIDVAVTGILRKENKDVVIVAEVSSKIDRGDVERAYRRGQIIAKAFGVPYIAIAIGKESTEGAMAMADELNVILI